MLRQLASLAATSVTRGLFYSAHDTITFSAKVLSHLCRSTIHSPPGAWIKSYNAMTFWASFPVRSRLPAAAQKNWPAWLNLALGYGVDRLRHGRLETYLAFDVHGEALIKSRALYLLPLRLLLNYVRLPLPALQLRPSLRFSPLHF